MLTDYQIEMLSDEQVRAKLKRLEKRWCRHYNRDLIIVFFVLSFFFFFFFFLLKKN